MPKDKNTYKPPTRQAAVAISDRSAEGLLPDITASGRGHLAERILELAFANGVKVRTDAPLAEMLSEFDIDSPIPSEAFFAVAEILSYVYAADGRPNPFAIEEKDDKED